MKKFLFALPILALAVLFTYCDRPTLQEELITENPNVSAHDRGTPCVVTIYMASATGLTLCGTNLNATNCSSCTGNKAQGVTIVPAGSNPFVMTVMAPIEFSVSSVTGNTITVNGSAPITIPGGGCKKVRIDEFCVATPI